MKAYIGTKIVKAQPMNEREWLAIKNGVSIIGGRKGYKVVYEDGYTSWCPDDVFERSYRQITLAEEQLIK